VTSFQVRNRQLTVTVSVLAVAILLVGCEAINIPGTGAGPSRVSPDLPAEYIVWGDPVTSDAHPLVRDANNLSDRGILVGTDGTVVFSVGLVCRECDAEPPVVNLNDQAVIAIRFGPDRDGGDMRRPYLVSNDSDANLIQIVSTDSGIEFQKTNTPFEAVAGNVILWGDPAGNAQSTRVCDATDDPDTFLVVGMDGFVQFDNEEICSDCEVDGSTITYMEDLMIDIRFGDSEQDDGTRKPFLVSADGFLVRLVTGDDGVTFEETQDAFEDPDDSSDDLAEEAGEEQNDTPGDFPSDDLGVDVGTVVNPDASGDQGRIGIDDLVCGPSMLLFAPLTAAALVMLRFTRRRR
jgi:hypothetical protein